MNANDKRKRPRRHSHQKGEGLVAYQKLTKEGYQRRREWLRDHHEKLFRLLRDS